MSFYSRYPFAVFTDGAVKDIDLHILDPKT
jgi:hypothetical protein